jgi:hypothetical protein
MAKDPNPNLFSRLTKLFRSGPVIKRTVKDPKAQTGVGQTLSAYEMFRKNHSSVYSSAMSAYGTYDRLARYSDFSEMDYYPEINSALDIYSEEVASPGVDGQILSVYSENKDVERLLNELFFDTLNVNFNLTAWVRNLCKYGDFCLFNDVHPGNGVLNVIPIPVNEIEREENYDPKDPMAVRYRWVTQGNTPLENWQVTHFRLLGNDAFLPYGSSVLEGARRVWRQLVLAEDAMLVYRVVRSPDRRVFYIDVGNVPPEEVPMYMEQAQAALKKSQVVDKNSGRVDMRYNPMPVHHSTPVPLLDGTAPTIADIARRMEEDPSWTPWVYSVQDGTKRVVPGKVVWCGKNYTATRLIRVWLDDGTHVTTAPEHPFVMRDGTARRADELRVGESLMPLYRTISSNQAGYDIEGYEVVYDPETETYKLTHRLVANEVLGEQRDTARKTINWEKNNNLVVHHRNFNGRDNSPANLIWMGNEDHFRYHSTLGRENLIAWNKSDRKKERVSISNKQRNSVSAMSGYNGSSLHQEHNEARRKAQVKSWSEDHARRSASMRWIISDDVFGEIVNIVSSNPKWGREKVHKALIENKTVIESLAQSQTTARPIEKFSFAAWESDLQRRGFDKLPGLRTAVQSGYMNHTISRIETLVVGGEDVYCMTVFGPEGEDDRHNFAVSGLSESGEIDSPNGIFVRNSVDEDYFIPVRGGESGTKIDTLSGGTNAAAIEDVQYIQKKLFAALKIPKAYLGYDESIGSKATLSQEDIRFSRTISRIQRTVIAELNKLAIIHLYSNGFDGDDLLDFTLQLPNPSTIAQQQKLDLYGTRFDIVSKAPEGYFDKRWLRKNLLGLTDEEIEEIESGRVKDKLRELELEKVQAETAGGGVADEPALPTGGEIGSMGGEPPPPPPPPEGTSPPPEGAAAPEAGPPPGSPPEGGPVPLDELQLKMADEEAPIRAQGAIDRSMRRLSDLPVVLSEARRARNMLPGETAADNAGRLRYNAKRRKPGGNLRASVDHDELVKHDKGDERDAITHPYGEKKDYAPSLKDLTPTLDESSQLDIDEMVDNYSTSMTNELNAALRSIRAGLPKLREDKE